MEYRPFEMDVEALCNLAEVQAVELENFKKSAQPGGSRESFFLNG